MDWRDFGYDYVITNGNLNEQEEIENVKAVDTKQPKILIQGLFTINFLFQFHFEDIRELC